MAKKIKLKNIDFKCACKDPQCGVLRIVKFDNEEFEFCFKPYKKKKVTMGIVVGEKEFKKLIKFLLIKTC